MNWKMGEPKMARQEKKDGKVRKKPHKSHMEHSGESLIYVNLVSHNGKEKKMRQYLTRQ